MEKITIEFIQNFLSEHKIELRCTQPQLCIPIIDRIYRKMSLGVKFQGIKVDDNIICDGHHRYIASMLIGSSIDIIPSLKTSATNIINWSYVVFVEEDWDTPAKINMLNQQDAHFNNLQIDELLELLK